MSDATGKTYKVDCSDVAITVTGTTGISSVSGNELMNDGKYIIKGTVFNCIIQTFLMLLF